MVDNDQGIHAYRSKIYSSYRGRLSFLLKWRLHKAWAHGQRMLKYFCDLYSIKLAKTVKIEGLINPFNASSMAKKKLTES